ncbi:deoxycytidylate deaminase [Streptomyces sp. NPDC003328]
MTLSNRPTWDDWALGIADAVATRGDCTRSKVGAVLLDRAHRVCASGYNGFVPGASGCLEGFCPRGRLTYDQVPAGSDYGNCIAIHAEENLLIHARREDLDGGTVYITRAPCYRCLPRLQAAGVFRVVWRTETGWEAKVLDWGKNPC